MHTILMIFHCHLQAYMEYTNIAVKGAVAAVDGNIPPINCFEHVKYGHLHVF